MTSISLQTPPAPRAEGLDLAHVLATIPHDPAAIIAYLFIIGSVVIIWIGSRRKDDPGGSSR